MWHSANIMDQQKLRQLVDMGFPPDKAWGALVSTRGDVQAATSLLLSASAAAAPLTALAQRLAQLFTNLSEAAGAVDHHSNDRPQQQIEGSGWLLCRL